MGFIPGFEQDVFISYAHVDNEPRFAEPEGWVTHLYEDLPARLRGYIGRAPELSLFMDPKLRGTDELDEALVGRLQRTAVLVCVLTQSYLESEWCARELRAFCSQTDPRFGLQVRGQNRGVKILVSELPIERHPEPLRGVVGYKFFSVEPNGSARRFRRTEESDRDQRHWDKLEDLARDLGELLKCMKQIAESPELVARDVPPPGPAVFVAEVTDDIEEERDQLIRALTQRGIVVLPQGSLPRAGAELEAAVRRDLERSLLSIHMLGQFYGKRPDGDARSLLHVQSDLAAAVGREGRLSRIAWLRGTLDVDRFADERQRQLVKSLENEADPATRAEVLRIGLEELKQIVFRRLLPARPASDAQPLVYLVCTADDRPETLAVKAALRRAGYGVVLPPDRIDPGASQETHGRYLKLCDVLLIVHGRAEAAWVQERAAEALEVVRFGAGRRRPLLAAGIYEAPPPDKPDIGVDTDDLLILNGRNGFAEAILAPLLEVVRARRLVVNA